MLLMHVGVHQWFIIEHNLWYFKSKREDIPFILIVDVSSPLALINVLVEKLVGEALRSIRSEEGPSVRINGFYKLLWVQLKKVVHNDSNW